MRIDERVREMAPIARRSLLHLLTQCHHIGRAAQSQPRSRAGNPPEDEAVENEYRHHRGAEQRQQHAEDDEDCQADPSLHKT
jgi:hypothetical protein